MTESTVRVRVTGQQFRHGGESYGHGDELEVPERVFESWRGRLERVDDTDETETDPETCDHVIESSGEVCGRELPCQYHSDAED